MTLLETVQQMRQDFVALVLGDPIEDVYHFGRVDRLSPEAPVPVFIEEQIESRAGGAANVHAQLAELGLVTRAFFPKRMCWSVKHRYMVGRHQLFRHDQDVILTPRYENESWDLSDVDVVVISDYAKGACQPARVERLLEQAASEGVPSVVDPKGTDWDHYIDATVICPNLGEWRAMEAQGNIRPVFRNVVRKRGAEGLDIWEGNKPSQRISARAQTVYDVTGAGDTVTAVLAAALATGADLTTAATLANLAAGYVVGQVGTTVCPVAVLERLAKEQDDAYFV